MQETNNWRLRLRPIAAVTAALAVAALTACNRPADDRTAGERVDSAIAKTERKTNEAKEETKAATSNAGQAAERMANDVSDKVKDAAITTAVNAKIAGDPRLSVIRINVDTVNGRVVLRGTAPDATSSERAQQLAASVEGVLGVDNQLVIGGKG